ncbi:hypothetical protein ECIV_ORF101 [European chub iridovirus]|nr:hypothetical protein ECIV_ORF101 [European chub iridovirus]
MYANTSNTDLNLAKHISQVAVQGKLQDLKTFMLDAQDLLPNTLSRVVRELTRHYPVNFVIALMNRVHQSKEHLTDVLNRMHKNNAQSLDRAKAYMRYCSSLRRALDHINVTCTGARAEQQVSTIAEELSIICLNDLRTAQVMFYVIFYNDVKAYVDRMIEYAYDTVEDFKNAVCIAWAHLCPLISQPYTHVHRLRVERQQYEPPILLTNVSETYAEYATHATREEMDMLERQLNATIQMAHRLYDAIKGNLLFKETHIVRNDPVLAQMDITQYFYSLPSRPVEEALRGSGGIDDYVITLPDGQLALRADVQNITHQHIVPSPTAGAVYNSANFDHFAEINQIQRPENDLIDLLKHYIYRLKFSPTQKCAKCHMDIVQAIQSGYCAELAFCSVECATA